MSEHERLKEICKIINFNITNSELDIHHSSLLPYFHKEPMFCRYYNGERNKINVREIIFTQEFMDKFIAYRKNWKLEAYPLESLIGTFAKELLGGIEDRKGHLNNPVDYLYKILGLNTK